MKLNVTFVTGEGPFVFTTERVNLHN